VFGTRNNLIINFEFNRTIFFFFKVGIIFPKIGKDIEEIGPGFIVVTIPESMKGD
jgi:hypothetical protein